MTSTELFNDLHGKQVSRNDLQEILERAKTENAVAVVYRISKILNDNPQVSYFEMNIIQYPAPQGLAGTMHTGDYREALDDCGRLRKGWKFVKGSVVKSSRVKKTPKSKGDTSVSELAKQSHTPKAQEKTAKKNCKTCEKTTKKTTSIDELYQKFVKDDKNAKPLLYEDVAKKFNVHKMVAFAFETQNRYSSTVGNSFLIGKEQTQLAEDVFGKTPNRFFSSQKDELGAVTFALTDFSKEIVSYIFKRRKWKKYGLAAPQPQLSTEYFKNMKVSELRKFTLDYYNTHLKGKKTAIKNHLKEVVFVSSAGRKLMQPIYKEKVAVIEHLERLIKNSTYNNWGNRKKTDSPDVLGYLNFKSKITIDGEKRHVRISVILDDKRKTRFKSFDVGANPKQKKESDTRRVHFGNPKDGQVSLSRSKNTKKSSNRKKNDKNFGLGLPLTDEIRKKAFTDKGKLRKGWYYEEGFLTDGKNFYIPHNEPPIFYEEIIKEIEDKSNKKLKELKKLFNEKEADYRKRRKIAEKIKKKLGLSAPVSVMQPAEPETKPSVFVEESPLTPEGETYKTESVNELPTVSHRRKSSLAQQIANQPVDFQSYQIDRPDMAQFLGEMEIKNVDSLVITLTGGQGSGKTRFAFQFMNDLAQRYKVGHISIEEHPQSRLYIEKAHQYLNQNALNNIEAHDVRSLSEIDKIIRENDVIVIDSYQKIKEIDSKFEVDKDLRKKYNGKLFLVIFQQTSDGKMRGGSKSQFDGDIILFTEKFPNYQENYVYPDKNRYNSIPANELKYNIFQQTLIPVELEEQTVENQTFDVIY